MSLHNVGSFSTLKEKGRLRVVVCGEAIAIFYIDQKIYAIQDTCSHAQASLFHGEIVNKCCIECPRHASQFDISTGKVVTPPASSDLQTYVISQEGDDLFIDIDEESSHE